MLKRMRATLPVVVVALFLGCGDSADVNIDFDEEDSTFAGRVANLEPGDEFAMLTENGAVRLALTRERVYFQVSEAVREHVDSTIREELEASDSRIARSIGSAVRRGVVGALEFDIDFRLDDIRDVDYRDGELVFEFEDPDDARALRNLKVDDEPLTRAFSERDARDFVAAFRRVKAAGSADPATARPRADTAAGVDTAAVLRPDTSGGASF